MEPIRLHIESATAAGAPDTLEDALRMVAGVVGVRLAPGGDDVLVEAAETIDADELIAAALKAGYVVTVAG
jgi:hypothetical protein